MDHDVNNVIGLFSRYLVILFLGINNLYLFYAFLTPVTMKVLSFFLSLGNDITVYDTFIHMNNYTIAIVPACVAGAAFYLMLILVFSTPHISLSKRLLILLTSFVSLFLCNIMRILLLLLIIGQSFFETFHWIMWNITSALLVVILWVIIVKGYKIKSIPIYTDLKYMYSLTKKKYHNHS